MQCLMTVMAEKLSGFDMLHRFIKEYIKIITDDVARCHVRHRGTNGRR